MTIETPGQETPGQETPGGGAEQPGAAGGGTPEWMAALPEDLRADPTLSRYADLPALARGHLETKKLASSRVIVPAADADEAAWNSFYEAAGRPADPKDYDIPVPEGEDAALAEAFRPVAHKLGLLPHQAKALVEWNNEQQKAAYDGFLQKGAAELDALKAELGQGFDGKIAAARAMFLKHTGDTALAQELETKLGTGNLIKLFIGLAEATGEHGRVDGEDPKIAAGGGDAEKQLQAKMKDEGWRKKVNAGDSEAVAEYGRLRNAAVAAAQAKRPRRERD